MNLEDAIAQVGEITEQDKPDSRIDLNLMESMESAGETNSPGSGSIQLDEDLPEKFSEDKPPSKQPPEAQLQQRREATRRWIAQALICILGGTIGTFILVIPVGKIIFLATYNPTIVTESGETLPQSRKQSIEDANKIIETVLDKDTINLIWTSQISIIGTMLGFFFGNQAISKEDNNDEE